MTQPLDREDDLLAGYNLKGLSSIAITFLERLENGDLIISPKEGEPVIEFIERLLNEIALEEYNRDPYTDTMEADLKRDIARILEELNIKTEP